MRIRPIAALFFLSACAAFAHAAETAAAKNYRDKNFDYFVSGDPSKPRAAHTDFGLALMGGGGKLDSAYRFIATHAGGGHIVILRAVSDDSYDPTDGSYGESFMKEWGPVVSAETIVFHHREAAHDPRVIAALKNADGIFLAGGDQSNYINYWKGTPVQEALNAHVAANRPIGGSSAGLAILGHYSYGALDGGSMESRVALANPFDAGMTLEGDFLHCPGLEHVVTDTHFSARSRLGRLIAFIARINHDDPSGKMFGIGVDEASALLVDDKGIGRLAAGSKGNAWIVEEPATKSVRIEAGHALSVDARVTRVDAGSIVDTRRGTVEHSGDAAKIAIRDGVSDAKGRLLAMLSRSVTPPDED